MSFALRPRGPQGLSNPPYFDVTRVTEHDSY